MDAGVAEAAEILDDTIELDETARRASLIEIDPSTRLALEERLDAIREQVAAYFSAPLTGREGVGLLRYPPGGFFRPHRDRGDVDAWPAAARRRIAVVVFLTTSRDVDQTGTFSGGALRFIPDDDRQPSIEMIPRAGTLVAFPATMLHEVTEVLEGTRDSVVDWYY
jgi:predicted 2-oxoglutarate/Fe(II)-dependent dioxygenase YbiX